MFESLGNKLQDILDRLGRESKLTEAQVKASMREIRMALLEADVNFNVAKDFVAKVSEKAVGQNVLGSLNAGQTVVKLVHDELVQTLGGQTAQPELMRGVSKGVVHKNTAARKISRLSSRVKALAAA